MRKYAGTIEARSESHVTIHSLSSSINLWSVACCFEKHWSLEASAKALEFRIRSWYLFHSGRTCSSCSIRAEIKANFVFKSPMAISSTSGLPVGTGLGTFTKAPDFCTGERCKGDVAADPLRPFAGVTARIAEEPDASMPHPHRRPRSEEE